MAVWHLNTLRNLKRNLCIVSGEAELSILLSLAVYYLFFVCLSECCPSVYVCLSFCLSMSIYLSAFTSLSVSLSLFVSPCLIRLLLTPYISLSFHLSTTSVTAFYQPLHRKSTVFLLFFLSFSHLSSYPHPLSLCQKRICMLTSHIPCVIYL